jgi:hypothetical protein
MTVAQLIDQLEQMNPEAQVRFASQPNWPFEYSICSVVQVEIEDARTEEVVETVYLEEGRQLGYLASEAKDELGW